MNREKILNIFIGIVIGMALGGSIAWAAMRITLQSGSGIEAGTTANPLVIHTN